MEVGFRLYYVSFDRGTDLIFLPEKFFLWAHGKKKKKKENNKTERDIQVNTNTCRKNTNLSTMHSPHY